MRKDYLPYLVALSLLSLLHVAANASEIPARHDAGPVSGAAAADTTSPAALIEDTVQQVMDRLDDDAGSANSAPAQLYALVNETVVPHLDMPRIARIVLGKHARQSRCRRTGRIHAGIPDAAGAHLREFTDGLPG